MFAATALACSAASAELSRVSSALATVAQYRTYARNGAYRSMRPSVFSTIAAWHVLPTALTQAYSLSDTLLHSFAASVSPSMASISASST